MRSLVVVLAATTLILPVCEGESPSVSLTVQGGRSLTGPHCPGTVQFKCEGVDITFIEWIINNTLVATFLPDGSNSTTTNVNVELINVSQNGRVANFSTILTADLSLLESQNVIEIACGGPTTVDRIPVSVDIIRPTVPETPKITAVTATYNSGVLTSVEIMWMKLNIPCPEYEDSIIYKVNLTSIGSVQTQEASCTQEETVCAVIFDSFEVADQNEVSISASNLVGTSEIGVYQQQIAQHSLNYFTPEVMIANGTDCRIVGQCILVGSLNTTCTVEYSTNPTYTEPLGVTHAVVGTRFDFSVGLSPNTTYYLDFSIVVDEDIQLRISTQEQITTGPECIAQESQNIEVGVVFGIICGVIGVAAVVIIAICIIIFFFSRRRREFEVRGSRDGNMERCEHKQLPLQEKRWITKIKETFQMSSKEDSPPTSQELKPMKEKAVDGESEKTALSKRSKDPKTTTENSATPPGQQGSQPFQRQLSCTSQNSESEYKDASTELPTQQQRCQNSPNSSKQEPSTSQELKSGSKSDMRREQVSTSPAEKPSNSKAIATDGEESKAGDQGLAAGPDQHLTSTDQQNEQKSGNIFQTTLSTIVSAISSRLPSWGSSANSGQSSMSAQDLDKGVQEEATPLQTQGTPAHETIHTQADKKR